MLIGKTIIINIESNDTLKNIKQKIQEIEGIPSNHYRLIYNGKLLENEQIINLQNESTIYLILGIYGGANTGFQAFSDFKKYVSTKLKISNGVLAVKIAASVNKKMKELHSDLSPTELSKKNMEYFDKNIDKIKSEFKELIEKSTKII
jgi:hypothetical protein